MRMNMKIGNKLHNRLFHEFRVSQPEYEQIHLEVIYIFSTGFNTQFIKSLTKQ